MGSKVKKDIGELVIYHRSFGRYLAAPESLREETFSWVPPVDLYETDECYVLNAELPGVEGKDIRIEVSGAELIIRGERRFDAVCAQENYQRLEGIRGRFHRSFSLPEALDNGEVRAKLKDGVLQVILPKLHKSRKASSPGSGSTPEIES